MEQQKEGESAEGTPKEGEEQKPELDKVSEIALKAQEDLKTEEQKPEAKDAGEGTPPDKKKTEAEGKEENAKDEQIEQIKKSTQARIDELTKEVNEERRSRDEDNKKSEALEEEIKSLRQRLEKDGVIDSDEKVTEKSVKANWDKFVSEDAEKLFAERREMSKEDLEDFMIEDSVAAQEWLIERRFRREKELDFAKTSKQEQEALLSQEEYDNQVGESRRKLLTKYPDLEISKRRFEVAKEVMTEEEYTKVNVPDGNLTEKAQKEKYAIIGKYAEQMDTAIRKENKTYDEMMKIIESNKDKYLNNPKGPEMVMLELDKILSESSSEKVPPTYTVEEVEKIKREAAEAERERLESIDNGGNPPSGGQGDPSMKKGFQNTPQYKEGLTEFLKVARIKGKDWTEQDYLDVFNRRDTIPGANLMEKEDAKKAGVKVMA